MQHEPYFYTSSVAPPAARANEYISRVYPEPPPIVDVGAQEVEIDRMKTDSDDDDSTPIENEFHEMFSETLQKLRETEKNLMNVLPSREEAESGVIDYDAPASPIKERDWGPDCPIRRENCVIDKQHCLHCHKDLGYAMPMNRIPKINYLFCKNIECQNIQCIKCWACGNYTSEAEGHIVNRPGNSFYDGPSDIFAFMCMHCYKDQMTMEPNLEETRELYSKYRAERIANEEKEKHLYDPSFLDAQDRRRISSASQSGGPIFDPEYEHRPPSNLHLGQNLSRKRVKRMPGDFIVPPPQLDNPKESEKQESEETEIMSVERL